MTCLQVAAGQQHTLFLMDEKSDVSKLSVWEPAPEEAPAKGTKRKVLFDGGPRRVGRAAAVVIASALAPE
jgi:hypothetical protein